MPSFGHPQYRSILALDIEASTTRTNTGRAQVRHDLYRIFESALHTAGIAQHDHDPFVDRGDGILAFVHPVDEAPKTLLLNTVVPTLGRLLSAHNADRPDRCLRLRIAVHAGDVHYDGYGPYGEDIDLTIRLLDAPEVKQHLNRTSAPLVLVVSEAIYYSVIRHGYAGVNEFHYSPTVSIQLGGRHHRGWLQHAPTLALPPATAADTHSLTR
jgi:class 3 adenylate cyclase